MSRVGRKIINIPQGVTVKLENGTVIVKGPKGDLTQKLNSLVTVIQKENELSFTVVNTTDKKERALWGLTQRLVENMIAGVTEGFSKQLEINGVGFKAIVSGNNLVLHIGYSHQVDYTIPAGITVKVEKNIVTISGADKQMVGQVAAEIRSLKKPEPYKGKGIKYVDEVIRRKAGKSAVKAE